MVVRIPIPMIVAFILACCAPLDAQTGIIAGNASPADDLRAVTALDRTSGKRFVGTIDRGGHFQIEQLPLNASYDCILDYGGARLEGINLRVPPSDYEEEQPLTDDDRAVIQQEIAALNKFEDLVEVLAIEGNIQHAAVLVHKLRTRPFVNSQPGEVVWRVELWHFERPDETWLKVQDELFVTLYRERLQRSEFEKKAIGFTPTLGGIRPSAESPKADLGVIHLPQGKHGIRYLEIDRDETSVGNALRGVPRRGGPTSIRSSRNATEGVPYRAASQ